MGAEVMVCAAVNDACATAISRVQVRARRFIASDANAAASSSPPGATAFARSETLNWLYRCDTVTGYLFAENAEFA